MEFILYLFLLLIVEIFVYGLSIGLDFYSKSKKAKTVKTNFPFFRYKKETRENIGIYSFIFQIVNFVYAIIYIVNAIIVSFFYKSKIIFCINIYSLGFYAVLVLVFLIVISVLSPKKGQTGDNSMSGDDQNTIDNNNSSSEDNR
ncbi:MAG: hypothetical protein J6B45_01655 [Clostridia bacterium]|nr:hypothetical protein [Clostridia bacterium]